MKKHIKLLTIGTLLLGGLTGCNDFLDREPLDKVIPEKYFASESDLAAYTINAYPFETVTDAYGINFFGKDNDTDNECPRVNRIERPEICDPFRDEIGGDFIHSQSK